MRFRGIRPLWAVWALVALIISGCAAAPRPSATATKTPVVTPTSPIGGAKVQQTGDTITWKTVAIPSGVSSGSALVTVSPVDGHDAWLCLPGSSAGSYTIQATRDAGATWQRAGAFTATTPEPAGCTLTADQYSTHGLMADLSWGCGACGTLRDLALYSADGGLDWRRLAGYLAPQEFASFSGGVAAILYGTLATSSSSASNLVISSDGFQTWRVLRPAALAANDSLFRFWLARDGASLIAASYNKTLWRTNDLGAHWTQIATPDEQTGLGVWRSGIDSLYLCGWMGDSTSMLIQCSRDFGVHWAPTEALTSTLACSKCGIGVTNQTTPCPPSSMAPDGSLLATCIGVDAPDGDALIFRLPPGSAVWQQMGSAPCAITLVPTTGPVWCAGATPDQATGIYYIAQLPF
jgi:hypothetical protein